MPMALPAVTVGGMAFVKLHGTILDSSVWSEPSHIRLVWLTLLILCDTEGYVGAAVPGIAHAARVTLQEAEDALVTGR